MIDISTIIETTAASGDDRGLKLDPPSISSKVREKAVAKASIHDFIEWRKVND